jgi:hypothetical protein
LAGVIGAAFVTCILTIWQQQRASMIAKNQRAAVSLEKLKAEKRQLELQLNLERTRRLVEALDSKIN